MTFDSPNPRPEDRPEDRRGWRRRRGPRLGSGLFLIALGLILALHHWEDLPFHRAEALWPLILIAFGLSRMVDRGFLHWGGHAAIVTGVAFELQAFGYETWVHRLWPLGLVWVGIILTLRALLPRRGPSCGWLHD
ncbi:MAG TPA: DUF5668 domain-containing protein [Holophagaceae bacterium]|nr:DUF5668 domain-containing protein [Holophagaceae bacterium]